MKICWADDQADNARTFASVIADLEADITFVADGEAALAAIGEQWFDLLVLDLQMPPGTWGGLWLLERLNGVALAPPALVLSGEGSQQETIRALRFGAADYVEKRNVTAELCDRVLATLDKSLATLIESEESQTVEFKRSLRYDAATGGASKELAQPSLKTIAAFANTDGGTLVIGRCDDGTVDGIGGDLQTMKTPDTDAFELHLRDLINTAMGATANHLVDVSFPWHAGKQLAAARVRRASKPLFMKDRGSTSFFVRTGNLTRQLDVAQAHNYIAERWPN